MTIEQRLNDAWQGLVNELELPRGSGPTPELRQAWLDTLTAAVEEEREACAAIVRNKLDRLNALLQDNPSEEGFAYSSLTAADIRDAINKRGRCNSDGETK